MVLALCINALIAASILAVLGKYVTINVIYGMLVPFAFCQGPGQAAAYGAIFEQYGWQNASAVAITFASIGFIVAFFPLVRVAKGEEGKKC